MGKIPRLSGSLGPRANLEAMITEARELSALGPVDFDAPIWEIELKKFRRPSSAGAGANTLYFTNSKPGSRDMRARTPLREPFVSCLKSIVRLEESTSSRYISHHYNLLCAGRFLHDTMESADYDPCQLNSDHFTYAIQLIQSSMAESTAYSRGVYLEVIADWLNRYSITRIRLEFVNPISAPSRGFRIGEAADARRAAKLPSDAALDALAQLSNCVKGDADVLRMRTVELLVCGGWRINELLTIPEACDIEEQAIENGESVRDVQGNAVFRYGIRYFPEKGAPPQVKWIPTPLVDIAKRALADIRRITQPTREVAAFMASNPGQVCLPGFEYENLEEIIGMRELAEALGLARPDSARQWCVHRKIDFHFGERNAVCRKVVAESIISDLPKILADIPLELHEFLFIVPYNFSHPTRASIRGSVRFVTSDMISNFIGSSCAASIFDRFQVRDASGARIRMHTHQFRHWLNTLASEGGMSELEIARWSGRRDVSQNATYDHVSGVQLAKRVRALVEAGEIRGPLAQAHNRLPPRDRKQFREAQFSTAHVTDIGLCVHDWSLLPCLEHGACADCAEHLVVKGDKRQRCEAELLLAETTFLLSKAEDEATEGTYGAGRWIDSQRRMKAGLDAVIAVHDDRTIPDGTLVHLGKTSPHSSSSPTLDR